MSATFTFKMREALATRLAKAATVTGLEPCDLARIAVANLVAGIEQHGRLLPVTPLPPLGRHESVLVEQASKAGTTRRNLARVLIQDGLDRLVSGEFIAGPTAMPDGLAANHKEEVAR